MVVLTGSNLTIEDVIKVSRHYEEVQIHSDAIEKINNSREIIDNIIKRNTPVYGVNTGFGSLCNVSIEEELQSKLQENLIRSHSAGFGDPFDEEVVRAILLIRINSLVRGYSGIRLSVLETMVEMLNKNVVPFIPEKGSLGASGDLAPLAHCVLPMLGLGRAYYKGELVDGKVAMERAGISTITLVEKEGLALINGTTVLTAVGVFALYDGINLLKLQDIAGALSLEAHRGIIDAFNLKIHEVRPQKGQLTTARNILALVEGSKNMTHSTNKRVQDAYSLRCMPQIHGASKDTLEYVREKVEIELNSTTDNPIITLDGDVISGGNFHGEPLAQPFDFLGIALAEIGSISERRLERLVNGHLSNYPSFLVKNPGVNSGFMIVQYSAASLVSENKILAHPASVDSIPSCENQEDFVSMGTIAARKAYSILKNSRRVVASEIFAAVQALDFNENVEDTLGKGTLPAYRRVREVVDFICEDSHIEMYEELEKVTKILEDESLLEVVIKNVPLEY